MDVRLVFPKFAAPPSEYNRKYFSDLVRSLESMVSVVQTPGEGRQTTIVLTNLTSNDYQLEPGTIFEVDGALRVSVLYKSYVLGLKATGSVGNVSVTV